MSGKGKKYRAGREKIESGRAYALAEAVGLIKQIAPARFSETIELAVFDAGDFFSAFGDAQKDSYSAQALRLLSYDFLAIGDQEFSNGTVFFRDEIYRDGYRL